MNNNYLTIELISKRKSLVQFLDRGVELVLLTALVVVPLGFPRFLVLFPLDEWPFSILWPKDWLTNHTPLNLKESLATFLAILGLMLWMMRTVASGKIRFVWTPLHWPFTGLLLLAGVSLLRPVSILPQMRDYCLVICYSSLIHLYLLYGYRDRKFRRKSLRLFLWVGAVFTAIVFAMDQGWTFGPFKKQVQDNRQALYATIGHNISVASYLMLLIVYLTGKVADARGWIGRIGYGLWALLCINLVVEAQTVGVWLALVGLVVLIVAMLLYQRLGRGLEQRTVRVGMIVSALILIVFVGFFAFNEMVGRDRQGSSPMERLQMRMDPQILQTGTRVRLWTISLNMIREHFPFGIGFGAFKYIYAQEQGRYFSEHPDSLMMPTPLHTDRVHNDYLQVWLELGALGLIAAIWGILIFLAIQGRILRSVRLSGRAKLRASAAFLAMAGVLLHLLTSFEMHVASSALFFIFGLMLWVGEGKFGRLVEWPMPNLARSTLLVTLFSVLVVLAGLGFVLLAGRHVISDTFYMLGENYRKLNQYQLAVRCLEIAEKNAPYRGSIPKLKGALLYKMGEEAIQQGKLDKAKQYLFEAEKQLTQSMKTYRHKEQNYYRARTRQMLGSITGQQYYLEQAAQDYKQMIEIYPPDLLAYYELGRLYYGTGRINQAVDIWKKAQHYDFEFMRQYHVQDAENARKQGRKDMAVQYYQMAVLLSPENPEYYHPLMALFKEMKRYDEGIRLGKAFLDFHPKDYWMMAKIAELELMKGDHEAPLPWIMKMLNEKPLPVSAARAAEYCYSLMGREDEGLSVLERWRKKNPDILIDREVFFLLVRLDELYADRDQYDRREEMWSDLLKLPEDKLLPYYQTRCHYRLAQIYARQGQGTLAIKHYSTASQVKLKKNRHAAVGSVGLLRMFEFPWLF